MYQNGTGVEKVVSIDRVVAVLKSPFLSYESYNIRGNSQLINRIAKYRQFFRDEFFELIETEFETASKAFQHRFKLVGGTYLEFGRRLKVVNRHVKHEEKVTTFIGGTIVLWEEGEVEYESKDSEYGIRVEFNPAKDNLQVVKKVFQHFYNFHCRTNDSYIMETEEELRTMGGFREWIKFNRVDIALDYLCQVDPLLVHKARTKKTSMHASSNHGVETYYLGSPSSEGQIRIYNKKLELEEVEKMKIDEDALWRFELQMKTPFKMSEPEVLFNANDFDKISVFDSGTEPSDYKLRWFMHDAARIGIIPAFKGVPRQTKYRMLKQMEELRHEIVNPSLDYKHVKELWTNFSREFEKLFKE